MNIFRDYDCNPRKVRWWHWLFLWMLPTHGLGRAPVAPYVKYKIGFGRVWILEDHWE